MVCPGRDYFYSFGQIKQHLNSIHVILHKAVSGDFVKINAIIVITMCNNNKMRGRKRRYAKI